MSSVNNSTRNLLKEDLHTAADNNWSLAYNAYSAHSSISSIGEPIREVGNLDYEDQEHKESDLGSQFPMSKQTSIDKNQIKAYKSSDKKKIRLHDASRLDLLKCQQRFNVGMQNVLALISVATALMFYEISEKNYNIDLITILLYINTFTTFFLMATVIMEYFIEANIIEEDSTLDKTIYLKDCSRLIILIINLLFWIIHPNKWCIGKKVPIISEFFPRQIKTIEINYIFLVINQARIYFFLKFFLFSSAFYTSRVHRLCRMYNFNLGFFFTLKSLLKHKSKYIYFVLVVVLVFWGTIAFRVIEKTYEVEYDRSFGYMQSLWFLLVTGLAIGYGDVIPITNPGRFIALFYVVLTLVIISNMLNLFENFAKTKQFGFQSLYKLINLAHTVEEDKLDSAKIMLSYIKLTQNLINGKFNKKDKKVINRRDDLLLKIFKHKKQKTLSNVGENNNKPVNLYVKLEYLNQKVISLNSSTSELADKVNKLLPRIQTITDNNTKVNNKILINTSNKSNCKYKPKIKSINRVSTSNYSYYNKNSLNNQSNQSNNSSNSLAYNSNHIHYNNFLERETSQLISESNASSKFDNDNIEYNDINYKNDYNIDNIESIESKDNQDNQEDQPVYIYANNNVVTESSVSSDINEDSITINNTSNLTGINLSALRSGVMPEESKLEDPRHT